MKLTVNLKDEIALQTAIDTLNAQVMHNLRRALPLGYSIDVSGQAKDLDRTWEALKWSFLLAVLITYLLMCSLYESFAYPLVILFSLPPALVGGVLGLRILHAVEPTVEDVAERQHIAQRLMTVLRLRDDQGFPCWVLFATSVET